MTKKQIRINYADNLLLIHLVFTLSNNVTYMKIANSLMSAKTRGAGSKRALPKSIDSRVDITASPSKVSMTRQYGAPVNVTHPELLSAYGLNVTLNIRGDYAQ